MKSLERWWGISRPAVILHIGAHEAEELESYRGSGWGKKLTIWVEAIPEKAEALRKDLGDDDRHHVIEAVAWDRSGEMISFQVTNNFQSSSALNLKDHCLVHPEITVDRTLSLRTTALGEPISKLNLEGIGFLNIDVQGAELRALEGLGKWLDKTGAIYCEVSVRELYDGAPLLNEVDSYLGSRGFTRMDWKIIENYGWGDALYLRAEKYRLSRWLRRFLRILSERPRVSESVRRVKHYWFLISTKRSG